jgi:hypothetical protein
MARVRVLPEPSNVDAKLFRACNREFSALAGRGKELSKN